MNHREFLNGIEAAFLKVQAHHGAGAAGLVGPNTAQMHSLFQARGPHGLGNGLAGAVHVGQYVGTGHVGRNHEEGRVGSAQGFGDEGHVGEVAGYGGGSGGGQGIEAGAGPGYGRNLVALAE